MKHFYMKSKLALGGQMRRSFWMIMIGFFCSLQLVAQVTITNMGEEISIGETEVYIKGSLVNDLAPGKTARAFSIYNAGSIFLSDSLVNRVQNPFFKEGVGRTIFNGGKDQVIISPSTINFYKLVIDKQESDLLLYQSIRILDTLNLFSGNLLLLDAKVDFSPENGGVGTGRIIGENNNNRIYTTFAGKGVVRTTMDIGNSGDIINPGYLGLEITSSTTHLLGMTEIVRGHGRQRGAGDGGISRYFDITPTNPGLVQNLGLKYFEKEHTGLKEEDFDLWHSADRGVVWLSQKGTLDATENIVSKGDFIVDVNSRLTVGPRECVITPEVKLGEPLTYLCSGDTKILDAGNPGMAYKWSTGETTKTIEVSEGGTYSVTVINANGCVGTGTIEIEVKQFPEPLFKASFACIGEETVFKNESTIDDGNLKYLWDFGILEEDDDISTLQNPVFRYKKAGVYEVVLEVTSEFGCKRMIRKNVTVFPLPIANFSYDDVCVDKSIDFVNNSSTSEIGLNFRWDFGDGTTSTELNPSKTYLNPGEYEVKLVVNSSAGCIDSVVQTLSVYAKPLPGFNFASVCKGESISLSNTTATGKGKLTYLWDFGDGTTSVLANPSKSYAEAGFYNITLTATSSSGCSENITQEIAINGCPGPDPVNCASIGFYVDLGPDQEVCPGGYALLDAGTNGVSYRWSDNSDKNTLRVDRAGTYWVEVMSEHGCMSKDYITVSYLESSLPKEIVFCQGGGITLDGGNSGGIYTWGSDQGVVGYERELQVEKPGTYWVKVERGTCSITDTVRVQETNNVMTANFLAASLVDVGDIIEFVQVSHPQPTEFYWNFNDGSYSTDPDPSHIYYQPGDYNVMLIGGNGFCSDTVTKIITVRPLRQEGHNPGEIAAFTEIMDIKAYPNPTSDLLNLEVKLNKEADVNIIIYSMDGTVVATKRKTAQLIKETFNFDKFPSGLYLVKIITGNQVVVKKIIKV